METRIFKIGNSLGVRIPKTFADEIGINKGDNMNITKEKDEIIISKSEELSIKKLFEGYTGDYKTEEIDWGDTIGDEVW